MDPQKLSQLDPKLRDAYQRVMGTPIPQPQTPPPPPMPTPDPTPNSSPEPESIPTPTTPGPPVQAPVSEPQSISTPQPAMPEPQPSIPQPEPSPIPQPIPPEPPVQTSNFVQMNSEVTAAPAPQNFTAPSLLPQAPTMAVKKKNGMMPILIGIGGLIFIAVYTLFWTKIFNFKLPF